jgi:hypothetical protein
MLRAMVLSIVVAGIAASPAMALGVACEVGAKLCHGTSIPKHKSCLRCSGGARFCNGHCIPKGMDCATPLGR